jgi:toxin-antitoxin system PIN domain toxin
VFVVDTNILIYAAIRQSPEHKVARAAVERWRRGSALWYASWPIVYEFLRVTTHPKVFDRPLTITEAWRFIESLRAAPAFGLLIETERHADILRDLTVAHSRLAGNIVHDLHTAALMREHGVAEIRTADTDFHQFPFLRVVNPLDAA